MPTLAKLHKRRAGVRVQVAIKRKTNIQRQQDIAQRTEIKAPRDQSYTGYSLYYTPNISGTYIERPHREYKNLFFYYYYFYLIKNFRLYSRPEILSAKEYISSNFIFFFYSSYFFISFTLLFYFFAAAVLVDIHF